MCIRDRYKDKETLKKAQPYLDKSSVEAANTKLLESVRAKVCLLYTSDAADERSSVDLGGRRIIKKTKKEGISRNIRRSKKTEAARKSEVE